MKRSVLQYVWAITCNNFNKGMRITAAIGLTSTAALNTYTFLHRYNDWRTSAAAAISFELMYLAAAWNLRLGDKWKWLSHDGTVIVVGIVCSTIYNVFAHLISEMGQTQFETTFWQIGLSLIMSFFLTLPACLVLLSIHGRNEHAPQAPQPPLGADYDAVITQLTNDITLLRQRITQAEDKNTQLETRWNNTKEVLKAVREKLR